MMRRKTRTGEIGATLLEFSIGASVFLTGMFAVIEFGRALWTHNALSDAARRAARYAVNEPASTPPGVVTSGTNVGPSLTAIRNVAIYGNPNGGTQVMVNDLTPTNINVEYTGFGVGEGTVTVTITNYQFQFIIPLVGTTITMPAYRTTLTAESAGVLPTGSTPPPNPTPNPSPTATPTPTPDPSPTSTPTPAPTSTPTPAPSATPTPAPSPTPLPTCSKNQVIGTPPVCDCTTKVIGNPPRCQ